ncbi:phage tail protein [Streptomyces sp. AC495_CC817]|uniref:phage tail protein n=1 Tax=Streptomyces sp. AC495_CC817 TaxID=2823900 RepID=UPI001C262C21|nr:tail fiber protein [Streptomyces sp. AC495_CC817]
MSEAFLGEIRIFAGTFAPVGWEFCDGRLVSIAENDALYALVCTTYGGDGVNTFALPDLRGRSAVHTGTMQSDGRVYQPGQRGGAESVTLTLPQLPMHSHTAVAATSADSTGPAGRRWAAQAPLAYSSTAPATPLAADAVHPAGNSMPHDNMPPYLAVSFIICTSGIFPSQN